MSKFVTLNNGAVIPSVGLGVYLTTAEDASRIVYESLKAGYRHIDSAVFYENEEAVTGAIAKWLKETGTDRKEIFYTTKILKFGDEAKPEIEKCLEKSKSIGYIDLILIHAPLANSEGRHGAWVALQDAVASGKVKSIGVSNYGAHHLKQLLEYPDLKVKPVVNQLEIHPWLARKELVKYCRDNGIEVQAFSPLVRGYRFGDEDVVALSKKYNVSEAQIMIRWSLQNGFIPLPKTVSETRLVSNLDVFDWSLSKEDMALLDAKDEHFVSMPEWDPSTNPLD